MKIRNEFSTRVYKGFTIKFKDGVFNILETVKREDGTFADSLKAAKKKCDGMG